ncbi:MAG TPA: DNA-directed RNA polymerase subunit N [Candidatus Nanoarchaeia archaeon]|nr:DNA-directed RNA polymerase subunit N [Candidatus Nanoarchaeia archaeon]
MIIPIRCFSCGRPVGHLWEPFVQKTNNKQEKIKEALDELGIERACCRSVFLGHIELIDDIAMFKKD